MCGERRASCVRVRRAHKNLQHCLPAACLPGLLPPAAAAALPNVVGVGERGGGGEVAAVPALIPPAAGSRHGQGGAGQGKV